MYVIFVKISIIFYVLNKKQYIIFGFSRFVFASSIFDWLQGTAAIGYLDLKPIFNAKIANTNGFVGYGTNRFGLADFDNFAIEDESFIPRFP